MNVYDFDGTIYKGDSTVDFYLFALKSDIRLIRFIPKQLVGMVLYKIKLIDKTKMKEMFFSFLSAIDADYMTELFWNKNSNKIFDWYLNQKKNDDVVISASPEFLLSPMCKRLGIKHLIASRVDSKTGKFTGKNCRGEEKVIRLKEDLGDIRIDKFYSDSTSDLPLAEMADEAHLIKKGNITLWKYHK